METNLHPSEPNLDPSEPNLDPLEQDLDRSELNWDPSEPNMDLSEPNLDPSENFRKALCPGQVITEVWQVKTLTTRIDRLAVYESCLLLNF